MQSFDFGASPAYNGTGKSVNGVHSRVEQACIGALYLEVIHQIRTECGGEGEELYVRHKESQEYDQTISIT